MKFGLFFLYGIVVLVAALLEVFLLNGGGLFEKDKEGYPRLRLKGSIDAMGAAKAVGLAVLAGLCAGLAPVSPWVAIICYVMLLFMMVYVTWWSVTEASAFKEIIVFAIILVVLFIIIKVSSIAMSGVVRNFGWLTFWMTIPKVALTVCLTVIVAAVLRYRSQGLHLVNPKAMDKNTRKIYSTSAVLVTVVGIVLAIVFFVTGIKWKGF